MGISSLCVISTKEPSCCAHCIKNLDILIGTDADTFLPEILKRVRTLNLDRSPDLNKECRTQFVKTVMEYSVNADDLSLSEISALLYLIEGFSADINQAPYVIEDLLGRGMSQWSVDLYSQLLSTGYAVFLMYPPAMQALLGRVMKIVLEQNNHELNEKLLVYYSLLCRLGTKSIEG